MNKIKFSKNDLIKLNDIVFDRIEELNEDDSDELDELDDLEHMIDYLLESNVYAITLNDFQFNYVNKVLNRENV
jgi:hypothetical protein